MARQWNELVAFTAHEIRPLIGETFAFEEMAQAHYALEERRNAGKVLVKLEWSGGLSARRRDSAG